MAWYGWYQTEGGDEVWKLFLAETREKVIKDKQPQFTTILDADNDCSGTMEREHYDKIHYRGPAYFDFDSASLDEVIPQFKKFLNKLKDEHSFDLSQAQLFASGGKGFHVVIPPATFLPKPNPKGFAFLPAIYKEMATELVVDTLDMRVYTARRGRQFRTANVKRSNGRYKVPITVKEAFEMTPEMYIELTSTPRMDLPPDPPTLNSSLALLFSVSHDKVDKAVKARSKSKGDQKLIQKFGRQFPPSVLAVMKGENLDSGMGFQQIATQLAITANALTIDKESEFLELCEGLCQNHQSDGIRYNTPAKRRAELSRMFHYMQNNPCYEFSVGGIKSLIADGVRTPDLDNGGMDIEDEPPPGADGEYFEGLEAEEKKLDYSLSQGMKVTSKGVFRKSEEGWVRVSAVGLSNPCQLVDVGTNRVIGYEVDVHVDGEAKGKNVLEMGTFISRAKFMQFTLSVGGRSMAATDLQVGALADLLHVKAQQTSNRVLTTGREGIDVVYLPGKDIDVIWADNEEVISMKGYKYRLVGSMTTEGEYKTDLRSAPKLEDTPDTREFFDHFFHINKPEVVARMFGWYLACFFTQPLRHLYEKFPLMQVFGPAGAGKTETNRLMISMHYYKMKPRTQSIMETTPFALEALVSGSGSIPLVLDEFKPREMRKDRLDKAKGVIRTNYNGEKISKGRLSTESGTAKLDVRSASNTAPLVFIGEAIESQSAILDRCVMVSINKDGKRGHAGDFEYCMKNRHVLSQMGRICLDVALQSNFEALRKGIDKHIDTVRKTIGAKALENDRPVYNVAIVLAGLGFGRRILNTVFGDRYNEEFDRLTNAVLERAEAMIPKVTSEASKVLDTLAYLSIHETDEKYRMLYGTDYVLDEQHLHMRMKNAYAKYVRYKRSLGEEALYDNVEAFLVGLQNYQGVVDRHGLDSVLKDGGSTHVFLFSRQYLFEEGIGNFKE